jgi:hypothetical protein
MNNRDFVLGFVKGLMSQLFLPSELERFSGIKLYQHLGPPEEGDEILVEDLEETASFGCALRVASETLQDFLKETIDILSLVKTSRTAKISYYLNELAWETIYLTCMIKGTIGLRTLNDRLILIRPKAKEDGGDGRSGGSDLFIPL